jgi:hypothetical protein
MLDKRLMPTLGKKKLSDITYENVMAITDNFTPSVRSHVLAVARAFLNWCVRPPRRYIPHSPLEGVQVLPSKKRKRVLKPDELKTVWGAAEKQGYTHGTIVQLLVATGQRRGEIANLRWPWINEKERIIVLPEWVTKNSKEHKFPYVDVVARLLATVPRRTLRRAFVFSYDIPRPPPRAPAPEFSDAGSEEEHMHISTLYESVTNSIIADLERGVASWVKPWKCGNTGGILPMNAATKRSYNGINIPILWHAQLSRGYPTASWMTYKQALELGAQVRGGEKTTHVVFTRQLNVKDSATDEERKIGMLKAYSVFNVAQIDGMPASTAGLVEETPDQKRKLQTFFARSVAKCQKASDLPGPFGGLFLSRP